MMTQVEQLVQTLENREAGWVVRRDAAELLGKVAHKSLTALTTHRNDGDMDVQLQVERSLESLYAMALPGKMRRSEATLRDLAFACDKRPARTVEPHENGYMVTVKLEKERSQKVYIMPHDTRDGRKLVRIYTPCGEPTPEVFAWALKANGKLTHGSFAIFASKNGEQLVLANSILRQEATPENVKMSVKQIAYFGDWLEQHINGPDEL